MSPGWPERSAQLCTARQSHPGEIDGGARHGSHRLREADQKPSRGGKMTSLNDQAVAVDILPSADPPTPWPDLLARLRAGDTTAFSAIVDEWSPVMLSVARRYVRDRQAAEDVVQDSWLGVMTGLARFEGRSSVRSWAFSIVINRAKPRGPRDARVLPSARLTGFEPSGPTVDPARFQGAESAHPGHWTSVGAPRPWDEPERQVLAHELGAL